MKLKLTSEFYAGPAASGIIVPAGADLPIFTDKRLWGLINPLAMELRKFVEAAVDIAVGEPYDSVTRTKIISDIKGSVEDCIANRKFALTEVIVVCDNSNNPPLIRNWNGGMLDCYHLTKIDLYFAMITWAMAWEFYLEAI